MSVNAVMSTNAATRNGSSIAAMDLTFALLDLLLQSCIHLEALLSVAVGSVLKREITVCGALLSAMPTATVASRRLQKRAGKPP